jgi:hypothetical protein
LISSRPKIFTTLTASAGIHSTRELNIKDEVGRMKDE